MLRYTYTSGNLYCCTSGHVTLSKITLSHHGVGVDIITFRQCTPCALYRTTLTVQCTFGAELCPQAAYTMYIT